jgi:hypothetical protein
MMQKYGWGWGWEWGLFTFLDKFDKLEKKQDELNL